MKIVIQRVQRGAVTVDNKTVGAIEKGVVILVGVTHNDTNETAEWLANKTAGLRIFEDDEGKMNRSLLDISGDALVVSQFTLYGDARKGRRPSFIDAAHPDLAEPLVAHFTEQLRTAGVKHVATGIFGAHMHVDIQNDGPVTLILER